MHPSFTLLDVAVLVAYTVGVVAFGMWFGGRQKGAKDYFLAGSSIPWWAICASIVATETSALTFISVPATAYTTDFWFLQLGFGYLLGRIGIAAVLLPRYFRGELTTAYHLLEQRFGVSTRRFSSAIFMVTRAFADSVRIFAASIPITLITGWTYWQSILLAGVVTLVYTYYGGLRAVIWVDVVQMALYLFGGFATLWVLVNIIPAGWAGIMEYAGNAGKLQVIHLEGGVSSARWLFTGLIGGAFLSMASHGVDHMIVQRLLAAPSLGSARLALVMSGVLVILQFLLFLLVGVGLYTFYQGQTFAVADEIFPRFIVEGLPPGMSGLIVAGILAAMMSTVASSLNSLASAATHDVYAPLAGREGDEDHLLVVGRRFTLLWGVILIGGAMLFRLAQQGTPVVVIALQIASFTYGGLLGAFLLGVLDPKARQRDVLVGMSTGIAVMTALWALRFFGITERMGTLGEWLAFDALWFSLVGSVITLVVGATLARVAPVRA